jgi:DNA anti-recombination protein RmuC
MTVRKEGKEKEELRNVKEEIIHQFHIISEGVISQVKQVAEGVVNVNERLERTREELKAEIDNRTQLIAQAVVNLGERLDRTRQELKTDIQETREEFGEKLDKARQELKTDIQESRQEVLAAIKFSYSDLDKRLTTLEKEFSELKLRVEKIEGRSLS